MEFAIAIFYVTKWYGICRKDTLRAGESYNHRINSKEQVAKNAIHVLIQSPLFSLHTCEKRELENPFRVFQKQRHRERTTPGFCFPSTAVPEHAHGTVGQSRLDHILPGIFSYKRRGEDQETNWLLAFSSTCLRTTAIL